MRKGNIRYMIIIFLIIIVGIGGIFIYKENNRGEIEKNKEIKRCVENALGVELGEGIVFCNGEVSQEKNKDEHVRAKFLVEKAKVDSLKKKLSNCLFEYEINEIVYNCNFSRDDIWLDLKEKKILNYYNQDKEGKYAKTIGYNAFIATDDTGQYYFYIFY